MAPLTLDLSSLQGQSRLQQILATSLVGSLDLVQPRQIHLSWAAAQLWVQLPLATQLTPDLKPRLQTLAQSLERQIRRLDLREVSQVGLQFSRGEQVVWEHPFAYERPRPSAPRQPLQAAPAKSRRSSWLQKQLHHQQARHLANPVAAVLEDAAAVVALWLAVLLLQQGVGLLRDPTANYQVRGTNDFVPGARPESPGVTLRNYLAIQSGMRYERVRAIFGDKGLVVSEEKSDSTTPSKLTLLWQTPLATSTSSLPDSNLSISVVFLGDRVVGKSLQRF